jgi:hypothetical protein
MTHTYTLFKPTSYAYTLLGARWRLGAVPLCVTCITTIDIIILTNFTNDAYLYDTYLGARWRLGEVPHVAAAARLLQEGG